MLADGRVLVVGGHGGSVAGGRESVGIKDAYLFNPLTMTWTRVADMHYPRWYPGVVTLPDGRVLVVGGSMTPSEFATTPEIYDPATNTWSTLPGAQLAGHLGQYPQLFLLPSGKVLLSNGLNGASQVLDVGSQTWTTVGTSPIWGAPAAMYRPGKILATGETAPGLPGTAVLDMNEASPAWRSSAPPSINRVRNHNLVVLPHGKVWVVGGGDDVGPLETEIWDPDTERWSLMASMGDYRMYHSTALLLPDGRLLSAGGEISSVVGGDRLTAQLYSPPYFFNGSRPTITSASNSVTYGGSLVIDTPSAPVIQRVTLIRLGSNTHNYDMDQRYLELSFTAGGGTVTAQAPATATLAPPGYYLVFVVDGNNLPSSGRMVRLN
jgi:hypothetical protein